MRLLSWFLTCVAGLVVLVLGLYGLVNGIAVVEGMQHRRQVADDVTATLERVLPRAQRAQDATVERVGREPDRRWIEQSCGFSTDDAGWIAQNYRETCVIRTVTAWQVDSQQQARGLASPHGEAMLAYDGCVPLGLVSTPRGGGDVEATYVDPAAAVEEPSCTYGLGTSEYARALAGERAALGDGRWLLLVAEQPLVDEDIGCAHWSVIFCDNPWTGHAFGEAPPG